MARMSWMVAVALVMMAGNPAWAQQASSSSGNKAVKVAPGIAELAKDPLREKFPTAMTWVGAVVAGVGAADLVLASVIPLAAVIVVMAVPQVADATEGPLAPVLALPFGLVLLVLPVAAIVLLVGAALVAGGAGAAALDYVLNPPQ